MSTCFLLSELSGDVADTIWVPNMVILPNDPGIMSEKLRVLCGDKLLYLCPCVKMLYYFAATVFTQKSTCQCYILSFLIAERSLLMNRASGASGRSRLDRLARHGLIGRNVQADFFACAGFCALLEYPGKFTQRTVAALEKSKCWG